MIVGRFDTEWKSRGCSSKFLVTHKQTEADMKIKWKRLVKYGTICEGAETKVRLRGQLEISMAQGVPL